MRGAIVMAAGMTVSLWGCGGHVPWQRDSASPGAAKYYNLGNAYFLADQLPEAILAFQRGLRLDPDDADVRANLDYVRDYNMLGDGQYIALGAKAPRPNVGKAFIDFFLDDESMKIQADTGEFVNRRGIYPPLADADKIKFVQMYQFGKEDYETKKKEYQKIFLQ